MPDVFLDPAMPWIDYLHGDKKMKGGVLEMTLLSAPGKPVKIRCTPEKLARAIKAFPGSFRP
jgi:3-dehydroquinate synthetase